MPAIGFVNEDKLHWHGQLKERTALLKMWLDAQLSWAITPLLISIDQEPLTTYEKDVIRGETITKKRLLAKGHEAKVLPPCSTPHRSHSESKRA